MVAWSRFNMYKMVSGSRKKGCNIVCFVSTGAINQLAKNLACEWAVDNIRTNSVAPWVIKTSLIEKVILYTPSSFLYFGFDDVKFPCYNSSSMRIFSLRRSLMEISLQEMWNLELLWNALEKQMKFLLWWPFFAYLPLLTSLAKRLPLMEDFRSTVSNKCNLPSLMMLEDFILGNWINTKHPYVFFFVTPCFFLTSC